MAHKVECGSCGKGLTITDHDVDVHVAVDAAGCNCCTEAHHHAEGVNGEPCRPLTIELLAGSATLTGA